MKNIKIVIATHKKYEMPKDEMYIPLHVGEEGKEDLGYIGDNTGDNISLKNPYFCELTGLYWAWKNLNAEYIGLSHYRRHFSSKKHSKKNKYDIILNQQETNELLKSTNIILPKKENIILKIYMIIMHIHCI